jgi:alkanesulfonate monooxygenase SsuD/methylene tetrahydromethanopterin reductase-like flavin-dependent oxidoreductase (luciferase family)
LTTIGLYLLGDLDPRTACSQLDDWAGPVWMAESPQGADPLITAAALRLAKPRRPVGFAVVVSALRQPSVLAAACRTLAASGEDVRLGIGVGDRTWKRRLGLGATTTIGALEEEILQLREHLDAPRPGWMPDASGSASRIPIYVGAEGPKMTDLAARASDGLILPFLRTDAYLQARARQLKSAAPEARVITQVVVGVGSTAEEGAASLQRWLRYLTRGPAYRQVLVDAGMTTDDAERYSVRVAAGEPDVAVPMPVLRSLCVLGTAAECAREIVRRYAGWNDELILAAPGRRLRDLVQVGHASTETLHAQR